MLSALMVLLFASGAAAQTVLGDWLGTLKSGAVDLRVAVHIRDAGNGTLTGTLDSLDQGATGIPITAISSSPSGVKFSVDVIQGSFDGRFSQDETAIEGIWTQGPGRVPLVLKRVRDSADLALRRPQNPVQPYPYREEEVAYDSKSAGITLSATLTFPSGSGPFPAVLLITGSGPQDRDESLMGHRPFLVLADYLTRQGIAVLRADDRGVGKSGGNFAAATSVDFASDAEAGIAYLLGRPEVNKRKIGLVGHSEGGLIAPMVAARNSAVAFIVLMAGPGVPGDEIIVAQSVLIAEAGGVGRDQAEKNVAGLREALALLKREKDEATLESKLRELLAGRVPAPQVEAQIKALTAPWYRYFIQYDPAPTLRTVKCPVLALAGEKDLQVPPKQNLAAIRAALQAAKNNDVEVDELVGLNHLFQTAKTGSPAEYGQIEETISPLVLDRIARWISRR
jgi:pimeloyl-ACP methyl ester carboxylesterase